MTARRLLYLDLQGLTAWQSQRGKLLPEGHFDESPTGLEAFARYLARQHNSHFFLLTNLAEEAQALETIPYLQGNNRQAVIERRIAQLFPGNALTTTRSLGYEQDQRKNEKLLISALANSARLDPWLQQIDQCRAALSGVYSISQLGGLLLEKLGQPVKRCLLLTQVNDSIRESYLVDGATLFSRQTNLDEPHISHLASTFASEAARLQQYLISQRLIGPGESLTVRIMAHPQALPAIREACLNDAHRCFEFIDNQAAATKLGLQTPPDDSRCESLFLQLLAHAAPRQQFASALHRRHFRLGQIRKTLIAAATMAVISSVLFTGWMRYTHQALASETAELLTAERDLSARLQHLSTNSPSPGLDLDSLRQLSHEQRELQRQQGQPEQAYCLISQALDLMPAITLARIDWNLPPLAESTAEIITLQGRVTLADAASPRQILATLDQFIERLRALPGITLSLQQSPFVIESAANLRGSDLSQMQPFIIEIRREITP